MFLTSKGINDILTMLSFALLLFLHSVLTYCFCFNLRNESCSSPFSFFLVLLYFQKHTSVLRQQALSVLHCFECVETHYVLSNVNVSILHCFWACVQITCNSGTPALLIAPFLFWISDSLCQMYYLPYDSHRTKCIIYKVVGFLKFHELSCEFINSILG